MTDLTQLSHDEFRDQWRAFWIEAERRLAGMPIRLLRLKRIHALANDLEEELHRAGEITTLSGGTDKPDRG